MRSENVLEHARIAKELAEAVGVPTDGKWYRVSFTIQRDGRGAEATVQMVDAEVVQVKPATGD